MDNRPFDDLHHIMAEFNDDRVWVFAEWVSAWARANGQRSHTRVAWRLPA